MNQEFSEEDLKKVVKGAGTTLIGSSIGRGLLFLSQVIIARLLGVEAFGLFTLGFAAVKICEIIARLGLNSGGMRFVSIYRDESLSKLKGVIISAIGISFLNGTLIGSIFYFLSSVISQKIFHKPHLTETLQVFSLSIPFLSGMTVFSSLLQGFHTTKYTVYIRELIQPVSYVSLIIFFYFIGFGLNGAVYAFCLSYFLAFLAGFIFLRKLFSHFFDRHTKPDYELKNLVFYSIPLLFLGFLYYFLSWTNTLMLGFWSSTKDVAIYRAASQLPFIMPFFLSATNSVYAPLSADLYQKGEMQRLSDIFKATTRWVSYITIPIFIFLVFSAKEVMMLFGRKYVETGYIVLIILSFGQLVNSITGGVGFTLTMTGKQRLELANSIGTVILNIILTYLLIPTYGCIGAALAMSISTAIINTLRFFEVKRLYGLTPFNDKLFKTVPFFLISGLLIFILKSQNMYSWHFGLVLNFIIVAGVAVTFFLFIFKFEPEDRYIIEKIKNKLKFT